MGTVDTVRGLMVRAKRFCVNSAIIFFAVLVFVGPTLLCVGFLLTFVFTSLFRPKTVWVNHRTGIYHYEGQRWFERTADGELMTEEEAIKEGDRASENGQ